MDSCVRECLSKWARQPGVGRGEKSARVGALVEHSIGIRREHCARSRGRVGRAIAECHGSVLHRLFAHAAEVHERRLERTNERAGGTGRVGGNLSDN